MLQLAAAYSDPRHHLHITDGIRWVQDAPEASYDAIIVDSSDPVGPAAVLFERVSRLLCESSEQQSGCMRIV